MADIPAHTDAEIGVSLDTLARAVEAGRPGYDDVARVLDYVESIRYGGPVGDGHYRKWLSRCGFLDDAGIA